MIRTSHSLGPWQGFSLQRISQRTQFGLQHVEQNENDNDGKRMPKQLLFWLIYGRGVLERGLGKKIVLII